jgi:RNA polymerase sigma factor (sigma-70 family)
MSRARDTVEEVALVARARRDLLLRAHRHRLRREDLEDCYSQATLELVARARSGARFASRVHLANTLEQRFVSRIHDYRRAVSGRSPMRAALETAAPVGDLDEARIEIPDLRGEPERLTVAREELRRVQELARTLSPDQQLVLACQVGLQLDCREFCARFGWSPEKYRKTAQRARTRLRALVSADERLVPNAVPASERWGRDAL